ncbi:MAG: hypothetical protein JWQ43_943 [Glaciihabitans sp.]|nr:hypothetical protein [Glaciihabitans sp.]
MRLDDVYPGWDGLEAASEAVSRDILLRSCWQRWDWTVDAAAQWHQLDPLRPIIVEGCGALSRANRRLATFAVWIEQDAATRKARALARDGDDYRPYWDRWAAQEDEFIARESPDSLADVVLRGIDASRDAVVDILSWRERLARSTMGR